jgi:nucleotide-binding universal stress UspA family protein
VLQKVLVPLDGSELAEAVIPYVEEICQRCDPVQVILLQVLPLPHGRSTAVYRATGEDFPTMMLPETERDMETARHPIYREQEMASARGEVEASLARAIQCLCDGDVPTRVEVRFGRAAEEIVGFAEQEGVDLIAMSTHGRSGLSRWFFGSVTEKVLRGTHLPLLLVHPPGVEAMPFPSQPEIEI